MQAATSPSQDLVIRLSHTLKQLRSAIISGPAGPQRQALLLLEGDAHRALAGCAADDSTERHSSAALASYTDAVGVAGDVAGATAAAQQAEASAKLALLCNSLLRVCHSIPRSSIAPNLLYRPFCCM